MNNRSFAPLFLTNFFGVVNDNFLKMLASFVVLAWLGDEKLHAVFMGATGAALVLPYILFSPLADRLTVVFEKKRILRLAKLAELPIVAVGAAGFFCESTALVVLSILLMGVQSSLYSPAKYALVRDVGGVARISTGMGGMEGVAFAAVLAGTIAASVAAERFGPWVWAAALLGFALLGLVFSCTIRADETKSREIHAVNPLRYLARASRMARRYRGLNAVILTLCVFWWTAAMLQIGLVAYGRQVLGLDSLHTGALLALAAVGIVAGQVLAGFVDRRRYLLGATLLTGWLAAALLAALFFVTANALLAGCVLVALAFDLGFFKLPLDAEIQKVVKGPRLNTMLAYFNQVSFLFMFVASLVYTLLSWLCGPRAFFLLLAAGMLASPFLFVFHYRDVLLCTGRWIFRRRYAVAVDGLAELVARKPAQTPWLVLPNHPAMVDPMLVGAEFWRTPLRPLCDESFFRAGIVAPAVLRTLEAVAVPDLRKHRSATGATIARGLGGIVTDTLAAGGNVIFYPSGHIYTENRENIGTRQLAYNICRELPANVRVIGVRTTGLWGSIWSRKGRTDSPAFVPTFVKSVLLWFFVAPFIPRRKVVMHVEDLTDRVREWSQLTRLEFNARLNAWYNNETI
ncbi:MAG: MFS transporter [Kiritimatiellia bacterium]